VRPIDRMTPWELLGLEPGAGADEIRRAYERLNARLAPGSLALYSIADREEQATLQRRLRLAFLELIADATDHHGAAVPAVPARLERADEPAAASPPDGAPEIAPEPPAATDADLPGDALRRAREAKGISLDALSHRTRIRRPLLEALEGERFAELPARVFVRGFVFAIAGQVGLDPEKVWAEYGRRWEAWSAARTGS